jgi:hypothetical protein
MSPRSPIAWQFAPVAGTAIEVATIPEGDVEKLAELPAFTVAVMAAAGSKAASALLLKRAARGRA